MALYLRENLTFETAQIQLVEGKDGKELYMEGICIQEVVLKTPMSEFIL